MMNLESSKRSLEASFTVPLSSSLKQKLFSSFFLFSFSLKYQALQLVDEECKRYRPNKNYLEVFGPLNLHEFEVSDPQQLIQGNGYVF